jgi:hypothetical protein
MFDDVIKTVKSQLYDRATSPLSGAFILSWCVWNWRLISLLISDTTVTQKFDYVDTVLFPTFYTSLLHGFLFPLATALALIFLYPWPARFVFKFWRNQQKIQKSIQQKIEDDEPLTNEESRKIKSRAIQSELLYEVEREQREVRIKELETLVKSLQGDGSNIGIAQTMRQKESSPLNDQSTERIEGMFALLNNITLGNMTRDSATSGLSGNEKVTMEHYIDELIKHGLITEKYEEQFDRVFLRALPDGRTALVNKKFPNSTLPS